MNKLNWNTPRAAMSDKSAIKEYGLTQQEIYEAVNQGKLQFRANQSHGNPYLRLLRSEVETLVKNLRGEKGFEQQRIASELKSIQTQIRSCKSKLKKLEKRRDQLQAEAE